MAARFGSLLPKRCGIVPAAAGEQSLVVPAHSGKVPLPKKLVLSQRLFYFQALRKLYVQRPGHSSTCIAIECRLPEALRWFCGITTSSPSSSRSGTRWPASSLSARAALKRIMKPRYGPGGSAAELLRMGSLPHHLGNAGGSIIIVRHLMAPEVPVQPSPPRWCFPRF
jgi:hypothetical protein